MIIYGISRGLDSIQNKKYFPLISSTCNDDESSELCQYIMHRLKNTLYV
jgi:hypothetical protein